MQKYIVKLDTNWIVKGKPYAISNRLLECSAAIYWRSAVDIMPELHKNAKKTVWKKILRPIDKVESNGKELEILSDVIYIS